MDPERNNFPRLYVFQICYGNLFYLGSPQIKILESIRFASVAQVKNIRIYLFYLGSLSQSCDCFTDGPALNYSLDLENSCWHG